MGEEVLSFLLEGIMGEKIRELELTLEGQDYQNVASHVRYPLYADKFEDAEDNFSGCPAKKRIYE